MAHKINRPFFYSEVRSRLFAGKLTAAQVAGMEAILNEWEAKHADGDDRHLAYMLATTYHETDKKMQPIEEYGKGKGRPYGVADPITKKIYYGRGFVQLTWKDNYKKMGTLLNLNLVNTPELALQLGASTQIMFKGMTIGSFTGKKLTDYFSGPKEDWVNARRIINGTDRAAIIADHGKKFYGAIAYAP